MVITDLELKRIVRYAYKEARQSLPSFEILDERYPMTQEFKRWMDSKIREKAHEDFHIRTTKTTRRIIVALIAAILAATITIASVSAAREWFFNIVSQIFPTHTEIQFSPAESEQQESVPFVVYLPDYLPDGFEMIDNPRIVEESRLVKVGYKGKEGKIIRYTQMFKGSANIDTENAHTETIKINGRDALYVQKDETKMLQGHIDNTLFSLYIRDPDLTKDDVIKIAESIKPVDEQN